MTRRLSLAAIFLIAVVLGLFGLCYFGIWIPNEPSRKSYPIRGIDVSHHQGEIQWNFVKRSDTQFAYIKATEGVDFKDDKFHDNWAGAAAVGMPRGAYHFFTLGTPGQLQAANFIATVPVVSEALPPAIDLEFSGYNKSRRPSSQEFQRELSAFWDEVLVRYRRTPIIYTTADFQKQYLTKMPVERLWIREVITKPREPWMFWQYSPRGKLRGVPTFVDLNVFHGALADFQKLGETGNN
jgi:lysozyme